MRLDEELIKDGITVKLIAELIEKHERHNGRYSKLMNYYRGNHAICHREREADGLANNKIMVNHAKYITDISTAYLIGNPVSYTPSDGYNIDDIINVYLEQDIQSIDKEIVKNVSIYGRGYELVYSDGNSQPRSVKIDPRQAFVVYNDDCTHFPLFGVYYYKTYDVNHVVTGIVCNIYTDSEICTYQSKQDNWNTLELTYQSIHFFGGVPMIEYVNNEEKQGDFEQQIPLIDGYNKLMSDRVNDKEQFVDAMLLLKGIEIDSEQAQALKREKILQTDNDEYGDAKYLSKSLSEADTKVLRDDLKEDIFTTAMVPDLSDEKFGNNQSGVAIKYKILAFEQKTKDKEGYITKGLKERFKLYNHFLNLKINMPIIPVHRIDFVFTHNLPVNNYETSQMITNLKGMVSTETLIAQLDFVTDPNEEAESARQETANAFQQQLKNNSDMMSGGGW